MSRSGVPINGITATGSAELDLEPQLARLFVGVQARSQNLKKALAEVQERGERVKAQLVQLGVATKDVQGAGFEILPVIVTPSPASAPAHAPVLQPGAAPLPVSPATPTLTEYQVTSQLHITVEDVSRLGQTLGQLTAAGVNCVDRIDCDVRDRASAFVDSRNRATGTARERSSTRSSGGSSPRTIAGDQRSDPRGESNAYRHADDRARPVPRRYR